MNDLQRTSRQEALKQEFHRCDAELIAAMNGIGRDVASDAEVAELRRAVLQARAACEVAGVGVESVWESCERERVEHELRVRAFAEEQRCVVSMFPRRTRLRVAAVGGIAAAIAALLHWPSAWGMLGSLGAGAVGFALVDFFIGSYFPTPGIRVGRMAASFGLGPMQIWDRQEDDAKDFAFGYRQYEARARRSGGPHWIKAR